MLVVFSNKVFLNAVSHVSLKTNFQRVTVFFFHPLKIKNKREKKKTLKQFFATSVWISISAVRKQNLKFYLDQVPELFLKVKEEHKSRGAVMHLQTVNQPLG